MVVLACASGAHAATFKVNRLDDPTPGGCSREDCSLREAVLKANSRPGGDTVIVRGRRAYELQIPGQGEDEGMTGDLDSTGKLTIEASGRGRATIDANVLDRVIEAFKGITLERLVITHGARELG